MQADRQNEQPITPFMVDKTGLVSSDNTTKITILRNIPRSFANTGGKRFYARVPGKDPTP